MNNYKCFYEILLNNKLINPVWEYILDIIEEQIINNPKKDYYLIIFAIYFALVDDGNICISLNKDILKVCPPKVTRQYL